jgi:hypothetical protein
MAGGDAAAAAAQSSDSDSARELRRIVEVLDSIRSQTTISTPVVSQLRDRRQGADFVQVFGDQQGGQAITALLEELVVDVFGRPNIDPTRRLGGDQHPWLAGQFPGQDQLLNIAPR